MANLDRRTFLNRAAITGGATLAMRSFIARGALAASSRSLASKGDGGYGPLRPTPTENTGEVLLALPAGFRYTVFGRTGRRMSDGKLTPPAHDGMAAFDDIDGMIRLVRNHEVPFQMPAIDPINSYDVFAGGGTTTLVIDPSTRLPIRDFVSLSGTSTNCAGGPTAWGSWITSEETVAGPSTGFSKAHGYNFEVPAGADGSVTPVPLKPMGRFVHEAVAVHPETGIVYETEDRSQCGCYRFLPDQPGRLAAGGRLQMLAIEDQPSYDTRKGQRVHKPLPVTWVDIDDPDPPTAEADASAVYRQGFAKGAALFTRLEGCWSAGGSIFFNSTKGGDQRLGQVWEYQPRGSFGGQLTLLFESPSPTVLDGPDNICVSPRGGIVLCEDGDDDQYLRGLTQKGQIFDFALNTVPGFEDREFAGATFSSDGATLFVNILIPGITFAIWGPWQDGSL